MTIYGWDLSHYDGPDARAAIGEGFAFLTHKAGGDAADAEIGAWWSLMKPYRDRVLLGAYWVLYPGSPAGRADAFLSRLDATCPGWRDRPFILQVDCEIWGGKASTQPGKADIKTFCDRLVTKVPRLRPIVYAPKWAYGDTLTGLGYPLWASSYVSGSGTASALYGDVDSSRWAPYSGQTPAILQFSSSATIGGQTTCDANAFRGTLAQLTALVAPGWAQEEDDMDWNDKFESPSWTAARFGKNAPTYGTALILSAVRSADAVNAINNALTKLLAAYASQDHVDEQALGESIATALAPQILAGLPEGTTLTLDEVKEGLRDVLRTGVGTA